MRRALAKSLGAVEERFVITVKTDNAGASADNQFTLPAPFGGFNYDVETSDGQVFTGLTTDQTFTFPNPGTYDLKISGIFPRINFAYKPDLLKLTKVKNWGIIQLSQINFRGCKNLTSVPSDQAPDLTNVTSLFELFFDCEGLTSLDLNTWDTSTINTLGECFQDCSNLTSLNINNWDVSNVTDMSELVENCSSLVSLDLSNWQTTSLVSLQESFQGASGDIDISNFDLSNVTTLSRCFRGFSGTVDVSGWDTSNISDMSFVFEGTNFGSYGIGEWNTSNATTMLFMLRNSDSFNESLASWDISNVTDFTNFMDASDGLSIANYNATLIGWAAQTPQSNINISFGSSQYSYEGAAARQTLIDTYGWTITDGGQVASPEFVISVKTDNAGTSADNEFTLPWIGTYDVDWGDGNTDTGVVDTQTHTYASAGTYDVKVTAVTGRILFNGSGDKSKLLNIKNWGSCAWTSMERAFYSCNNLTNIDATDSPDLSNATHLNIMFQFSGLQSVNFSNWNVENITNVQNMFYSNQSLTSVDFTNWNTNNFTECSSLFMRCYNLQDIIGLNTWNLTNCVSKTSMFRQCTSLINLNLDGWDMTSTTSILSLFSGCSSLINVVGIEDWNLSNCGNLYETFSQASSFNQNINNWTVKTVFGVNATRMLQGCTSFNHSLDNWDVSQFNGMNDFMSGVNLSIANYDSTLISWANSGVYINLSISFGSSQYTLGGAAESARNTLINTYGWTITDGGGI